MATIDGYFDLGGTRQFPPGLILARVDIPRQLDRPFELEIDTGTDMILLLDTDFLAVAQALGYLERSDGPIIQWMDKRPDLFERPANGPTTVAGPVKNVFRIRVAILRLRRTDGKEPVKRNDWGPVYGAFSVPFWETGRRMRSLLGRSVLNRIGKLVWEGPKRRITLRGVRSPPTQ